MNAKRSARLLRKLQAARLARKGHIKIGEDGAQGLHGGAHVDKLSIRTGYWRAVCSCGWPGSEATTVKADARRQLAAHLADVVV